jgi:hypothetical protein
LAEEFEGEAVFFGASNNDTVDDGKAYREEFGVPYELALAPEVWDIFEQPFRPTTIVIGADGTVVHRVDGPIVLGSLREALQDLV